MKEFTQYLTIFGNYLQNLNIQFPAHYKYHYSDYDIYDITTPIFEFTEMLLENVCAKGNIKHLSIENFEFREAFIRNNKTFFGSLRSVALDIRQRYFADCYSLFS